MGGGRARPLPATGIADPVPAERARRLGLIDRAPRFRGIHLPETMADKDAARRRLVFDELLRVQLVLVLRKRALERERRGHPPRVGGELVVRVPRRVCRSRSPAAQQRVIAEIDADLAGAAPDAPPAAGRRRLGQDGRRRDARCSPPCRAATRAR